MHKVSLVPGGKLKCENCDYFSSFCSPCRHVIACSQQKVEISDFHIRHSKSYNCGAMGGLIERHFTDFNLLLFRGSYKSNESEETSTNNKSNIQNYSNKL